MRGASASTIVCAMSLALWSVVPAAAQTVCPREAFEAVVDEASSVLVGMTQKNTPAFQARLRALKDKKGWNQDQFLKEGAAFVKDAAISGFDDQSQQLLIRINSQNTETADCRLLGELKTAMTALVDTQNAKWTYMFDKVSKAMGE
jgi:predicted dithiol-disulfide oxidoreductase (DUF899 family)